MPSAGWEIKKGENVVGPYPTTTLRTMASNGLLETSDLIRKEGTEKWTKADKVKGLFDSALPEDGAPQQDVRSPAIERVNAVHRGMPPPAHERPQSKELSEPAPNESPSGYRVDSSLPSNEESTGIEANPQTLSAPRRTPKREARKKSRMLLPIVTLVLGCLIGGSGFLIAPWVMRAFAAGHDLAGINDACDTFRSIDPTDARTLKEQLARLRTEIDKLTKRIEHDDAMTALDRFSKGTTLLEFSATCLSLEIPVGRAYAFNERPNFTIEIDMLLDAKDALNKRWDSE